MVSLKFRTYKKAKEVEKALEGIATAEADVALVLAMYLNHGDKSIRLTEFINNLPDTIWQSLEEYAIIVSGDKK